MLTDRKKCTGGDGSSRGTSNDSLIYVNTSKQVGDADHLKVFANTDAAETWFEENDPEGSHSNTRSWSERIGRAKFRRTELPRIEAL